MDKRKRVLGETVVFVIMLAITAGVALRGTPPLFPSPPQFPSPLPLTTTSSLPELPFFPFDIVVTQQIVDKTDRDVAGNSTVYIYDVEITNIDATRSHVVDPANFGLVSNTSKVYGQTLVGGAIKEQLVSTDVMPNQHVVGQIAFRLPNSEVPAGLQYTDRSDSAGAFFPNLPRPSTWVSWINSSSTSICCIPNLGGNLTEFTFVGFFVQNSSDYFYTGNTISLTFGVLCASRQNSVAQVSMASITENDSLRILSVSPSLPLVIRCLPNGTTTNMAVDILAPALSYDKGIHINITTVT
jgi:hypothetical protein